MNYSQQFVHSALIVIIFISSFAMRLEPLPTTCARHVIKNLHAPSPCSPPASAYVQRTDSTELSIFGTELSKKLIAVLEWRLMLLNLLV